MLLTRVFSGSRTFESAYRVWEFRRLLHLNKGDAGLVQFWGVCKRRYKSDHDQSWSPWQPPDVHDPDHLCTVDINDVVDVIDPKRP